MQLCKIKYGLFYIWMRREEEIRACIHNPCWPDETAAHDQSSQVEY